MKRLNAAIMPDCPPSTTLVPVSAEAKEAASASAVVASPGPQQPWRPSWQREREQIQQEAVKDAPALGLRKMKSGLKNVNSNSSVSTMVPQDWDTIEDDEEPQSPQQLVPSDLSPVQETGSHQQSEAAPKSPFPLRVFHHSKVPKSQNLVEEFSRAQPDAPPPTTMMIRNIPNRYTQRELIKELEALGFAGSFDFFYSPIDTGSMGNVGYAFVNFRDGAWAERCLRELAGFTFKKHQQKTRTKVAAVSVAHLQGLEANLRHYDNAAVNGRSRSKKCSPVIMTSIASAITSA